MATAVLLPAPVASGTIRIGQILTDPLNAHGDSFISEHDSLPLKAPVLQTDFSESICCDDGGRFIAKQSYPNAASVMVQADQMIHTTLRDPLSAFRYTSRRASSQAYLHKAALRRQPLFFVTGLQKLINPHFTSSNADDPAIGKSQSYRHDSGVDREEHDNDVIYAVQLRKVFCRIGTPEEPQRPSDVGYVYKHYRLQGEENLQLAVGFGQSVTPAEFRTLVSMSSDSDFTDESADSSEFDDDEDEGCMCCASSVSNAQYRRY